MELNNRFTEKTIKLLIFCDVLDPIDEFKSFSINSICILAKKLYPQILFRKDLRRQLNHYKYDIINHLQFQHIIFFPNSSQLLVETKIQHIIS